MLPFPNTTRKRSILRRNRAMLLKKLPNRMREQSLEAPETPSKPRFDDEAPQTKEPEE